MNTENPNKMLVAIILIVLWIGSIILCTKYTEYLNDKYLKNCIEEKILIMDQGVYYIIPVFKPNERT